LLAVQNLHEKEENMCYILLLSLPLLLFFLSLPLLLLLSSRETSYMAGVPLTVWDMWL